MRFCPIFVEGLMGLYIFLRGGSAYLLPGPPPLVWCASMVPPLRSLFCFYRFVLMYSSLLLYNLCLKLPRNDLQLRKIW